MFLFRKNYEAFKLLIEGGSDNEILPFKTYVLEKFNRYVISENPNEWRYGLSPQKLARLESIMDVLDKKHD